MRADGGERPHPGLRTGRTRPPQGAAARQGWNWPSPTHACRHPPPPVHTTPNRLRPQAPVPMDSRRSTRENHAQTDEAADEAGIHRRKAPRPRPTGGPAQRDPSEPTETADPAALQFRSQECTAMYTKRIGRNALHIVCPQNCATIPGGPQPPTPLQTIPLTAK